MPRKQWNDGMELVQDDFSSASSVLEMELYDRLVYELMNRQQDLCFGDSFKASYVSALVSEVALGNGVYFDNTQVSPEPMTRLLYLEAAEQLNHTAAHATYNRIDVICVEAVRATTVTESRNFKNASTGVVTPISMDVQTDWVSEFSVVAGTPSGSPAVPATPAGKMAIAQVLVTAVSGISGAGAYTDVRTRYKKPSGWANVVTKSAAYTVDVDDETILINGAYTMTLPTAASCYDSTTGVAKIYTFIKIDAGSASTIAASGAETISGESSQSIDNRYTTLRLTTNGTAWYLI
jgi:hypothetical protein